MYFTMKKNFLEVLPMTITDLILDTVLENIPSETSIACAYILKEQGMVEVVVKAQTVNPCKQGGEDLVSQRRIMVEWNTLPSDIVSEFTKSADVKRVERIYRKKTN
jgi:hypothetical protein